MSLKYDPKKNNVHVKKDKFFFNDIQQIIDMVNNGFDKEKLIECLKNTKDLGYNLIKLI
ncbi:MAG: hypothetical protein PHW73_01100 [Atribacterota bacterium]|nr:hypothetical protein [Atribacterota bacterium]